MIERTTTPFSTKGKQRSVDSIGVKAQDKQQSQKHHHDHDFVTVGHIHRSDLCTFETVKEAGYVSNFIFLPTNTKMSTTASSIKSPKKEIDDMNSTRHISQHDKLRNPSLDDSGSSLESFEDSFALGDDESAVDLSGSVENEKEGIEKDAKS